MNNLFECVWELKYVMYGVLRFFLGLKKIDFEIFWFRFVISGEVMFKLDR